MHEKAKRKQLPKQQSDQEPRRLASYSSHHEGERRRTNPEDEAQRKQHKRQSQIHKNQKQYTKAASTDVASSRRQLRIAADFAGSRRSR